MSTPTLSTTAATWLIAKREINSQVRSKSFIISSAILVIAVFALSVFVGIMSGRDAETTAVAVVPQTESVLPGTGLFDITVAEDEGTARALVADGTVDAAVVPDQSADSVLGWKLVANEEVPSSVQMATSISPPVELLSPIDADAEDDANGVNYVLAVVFGMIFMTPVMGFGSTIAQNTVVEKQTRTVELLISAVSPRALLAGKILGNSFLAITQTGAVVLAGVLGLLVTGQGEILGLLQAPVIWFVIYFVFGFVLFAAIFAASASLVSRIEDTGSVLSPVIMLAMAPYFVAILFAGNPTMMEVTSFVPFTSPVTMPVRLLAGDVALWQPLTSLLILLVTDALVIALAARIYRSSVLRTSGRVRLKEAWRGEAI